MSSANEEKMENKEIYRERLNLLNIIADVQTFLYFHYLIILILLGAVLFMNTTENAPTLMLYATISSCSLDCFIILYVMFGDFLDKFEKREVILNELFIIFVKIICAFTVTYGRPLFPF